MSLFAEAKKFLRVGIGMEMYAIAGLITAIVFLLFCLKGFQRARQQKAFRAILVRLNHAPEPLGTVRIIPFPDNPKHKVAQRRARP
jgi:hypothetical protein